MKVSGAISILRVPRFTSPFLTIRFPFPQFPVKYSLIHHNGVPSFWVACLFCILLLSACGLRRQGGAEADGEPEEQVLECRPTEVEGGYGYLITLNGDTLIYQPFIPAIGGFRPFDSEEQAMSVGRLVAEKMLQGEPPTLTPEEVQRTLGSEK